jgi:hypothetical protein
VVIRLVEEKDDQEQVLTAWERTGRRGGAVRRRAHGANITLICMSLGPPFVNGRVGRESSVAEGL